MKIKNTFLYIISILIISIIGLILLNHPYIKYFSAIKKAEKFWVSIINSDIPPTRLNEVEFCGLEPSSAFYLFKIWFYDFGPLKQSSNFLNFKYAGRIERKTDSGYFKSNDIAVSFKYGYEGKEVLVTIKDGERIFYPHLDLDNCLWNPDKNTDGILDLKDIELLKSNKINEK